MPPRPWHVLPSEPAAAAALSRGLGISPLTAQLLLHRGARDLAAARGFLQPTLDALHDPALLPGLPEAVRRIDRALRAGERLAVYGDYDVDGVTATVLLVRCFRLLGADVPYAIPQRVEEGYGLNVAAVERLAAEGVRLLVTVDCGTTDLEPIGRARELGMDVIVTDHHEPPPRLPEPFALVNPKLPGSAYPGRELCGIGLAFKLAWALLQAMPESVRRSPAFEEFLVEALALTALGTVADVAPLVGENRVLVAYGLGALRRCRNPGLRALLERSGLAEEPLVASHLAFRLAPRLNAGGRLGSALRSVRLFLTDDPAEAGAIADALEDANGERQKIEAAILRQARERVEQEADLDQDRALVLADDRWHAGVIGIVAARLVEAYQRPVMLIALDGASGKASGRSIPGFPLHEALERCREHLTGFGGHAMAAGMRIGRDRVDAFGRQFRAVAAEAFAAGLPPRPLRVDAEAALGALPLRVAREIDRLAPHGVGNDVPVLAVRGARVAGEPRRMGRRNDHVSFTATHHGVSLRAVWWGGADALDRTLTSSRLCDIAFTPSVNAWMGEERVELVVKDLQAR